MLLSKIRFEENKCKVSIHNDVTKEDIYKEFSELKDATDYILHFEEDYYDFKFNPVIFEVNYERFKLIREHNLNPSEELLKSIRTYNRYYERMLIESNYYRHVAYKDKGGNLKEIYGIDFEERDDFDIEYFFSPDFLKDAF